MEKTLVPGKTYTVTTASECAVTDSNGLVLCTATAGEQKAFVATTSTITFSDDSATVTAVFKSAPALGSSGGSGGGGTPGTPAGFGTPTASATALEAGAEPTIAVTASGLNTAKVFDFAFGIPRGEKGEQGIQGIQGIQGEKGDKGDTGLTSEQIELLTTYASAAGQNVSIGTDGTFTTQVGHTYVVTAESSVTVTQGDVALNISAGTQQGFVATGTTATVSQTTCTITEVFRAAATVELGGASGGGEIEGDYLTYAADGAITGGRMDEVTDISYICYQKKTQTEWNIPLPKVTNASNAFASSGLTSLTMTLPEATNVERLLQSTASLVEVDLTLPKAANLNFFLYSSAAQRVKLNLPNCTANLQPCRAMPKLTYLHVIAPKNGNISEMASDSSALSDFYWDGGTIYNATKAFQGCVLNKASVLRMVDYLRSVSNQGITLGIHVDHQADAEVLAAIDAITAKGWNVTVQWNGTASA